MGIPIVDEAEVNAYHKINEIVDSTARRFGLTGSRKKDNLESRLEAVNTNETPQNLEAEIERESRAISTSIKYATLLIGAYFTYNKAMSYLRSSNEQEDSDVTARNSTNSQSSSFLESFAGKTLKLVAGAYIGREVYVRFNEAANYYLEHLHETGMEEQHMRDLAYIFTFGEQPPIEGYRGNNFAYRRMYNTLKRINFHTYDNTQTGKRIIMAALTFGRDVSEKMGEQTGGAVFKTAKEMKKSSSKKAT